MINRPFPVFLFFLFFSKAAITLESTCHCLHCLCVEVTYEWRSRITMHFTGNMRSPQTNEVLRIQPWSCPIVVLWGGCVLHTNVGNLHDQVVVCRCSWEDRLFGMLWVVYSHSGWLLHNMPLPLHHLVLFEGVCVCVGEGNNKWFGGLELSFPLAVWLRFELMSDSFCR